MTPTKINMNKRRAKEIRKRLNMSAAEFGHALGYLTSDAVAQQCVYSLEAPNGRPIPERTARLIEMFGRFGVPEDYRA